MNCLNRRTRTKLVDQRLSMEIEHDSSARKPSSSYNVHTHTHILNIYVCTEMGERQKPKQQYKANKTKQRDNTN